MFNSASFLFMVESPSTVWLGHVLFIQVLTLELPGSIYWCLVKGPAPGQWTNPLGLCEP